jgi:hypothetical protein
MAWVLAAVTAPAATPDSNTPPTGPAPATLLMVNVLPLSPLTRK